MWGRPSDERVQAQLDHVPLERGIDSHETAREVKGKLLMGSRSRMWRVAGRTTLLPRGALPALALAGFAGAVIAGRRRRVDAGPSGAAPLGRW